MTPGMVRYLFIYANIPLPWLLTILKNRGVCSRGGRLAEGLPRGVRDQQEQNGSDASHSTRARPQLFRFLLRDPQLTRKSLLTG